ncbi:MAG: superoxide dismutase [Candidatus Vogelbacteria bacterium]|nr:superoxide dismutase [Candidatus Vogelbacteria bacterium]
MHTLPALSYGYDALEPYIDAETMRLHHTKHHQTYVDKLNTALADYPDWQNKSIEDLLQNFSSVPEAIKKVVKNHGGGHANHTLWWQIIGPATGGQNLPGGELLIKLEASFGSFEEFKQKWLDTALTVFGSGWIWLVVEGDSLVITTSANQDSLLMEGKKPILGLDVWEHAYYLKYQNRRADYVNNFFAVINWSEVAKKMTEK